MLLMTVVFHAVLVPASVRLTQSLKEMANTLSTLIAASIAVLVQEPARLALSKANWN